jgi:amino acid adenylation domain-containing protein
MPLIDLTEVPAEQRERRVRILAGEVLRRPFDLAQGPVLRAALLRVSAAEHVVLFVVHHIASDGWSTDLLIRELATFYGAALEGRPAGLPELPIQYVDYAEWQRRWLQGERLEGEIGFWRRTLGGAPTLELPTDRSRPPVQTYRGGAVPVLLPNELAGPLAEIGRREGATPYMFLLAGCAVLLARYSGQEDISIGSPLANRTRAETEPVIGVFANSLVLRTDLAGAPGFREILNRVRRTALAAYAHQEIPFEKIVEELNPQRDLSRSPLFQVLLALQNVRRAGLTLPGLTVAPLQGVETTVAKFDLAFWLTETGLGISGSLEFNRDLFDEATAARMERHLRTLLAGAVDAPDRPFSELPLLTPEELSQLAAENSTAAPFSASLAAHQLFEAWVERTPDAVAAVFGEESLSYRELNRRANRLAHHLRALGVDMEDRVGFCLDRSPRLLVAVLAVMKAGGTYVPLDPKHPRERLAHVLGDCRASVLLTESRLAGSLEGLLPAGTAVVLLDREAPETAAAPAENLAPPIGSTERLAYIIYTSGSTGRPKGVQVPHRALVNFLESMARRPGLAPEDRLLAITTLSFDMAVPEVLLPLVTGARLVIAPAEAVADGEALAELLESSRATVLQATPTTWRLLMETGWEGSPGLRGWIGAEAVLREVADRLLDRGVDLWTFYGPTETTVWSTGTRVERSAGPVPLGTAFANTQIHVLDRAFQRLPAGVPGELYIGGAGVTRGYFGRPDLTAERYLPDPFAAEPGSRLYRTGDLVRRRADGVLEFLGRADFQVKIRGFRIELGEIEEALARSPRVRQAVVLARGADGAADSQLAAYVVPAPGGAPTLAELREFLAASLPDYMLPSALAVLDVFPLTPNSKIDRRALAQIAPERRSAAERAAPRTPLESFLAELWGETLGLDAASFGVHDSFFELGGSSISGAILINRLQETLRERLRVVALFNAPTVAGLAAHVAAEYPGAVARIWGAEALETSSGGERTGSGWLAIEPGGWREGEPLPLSFSQERLWFFEQMEPGSPVYHIPAVFRLAGPLDAAALEASLGEVVRRHAALRTSFSLADGRPVQTVWPPAPLRLPVLDLGALPRERREAAARSLAAGLTLQPFDLGSGPLLRAALLRLAPEEHVAVFVVHHIASDGWSMGVLLREVAALYGALSQGRPSPLPELPIQYPDYALWQRRWLRDERLEDEVSFWKRTLSGAPVLELPADHPRPPVQTYLGSQEPLFLPADLVRAVKGLGLAEGSTLFMTLLAGLTALLARYSGQEDVSVGSPVANRERVQTEPLIGFFVNTLVFRTGLSGVGGFRELLGRVRRTALAAYAHQELPFERVVEEVNPPRDLSRSPLFQVMLAPQNTGGGQALELPGLTLLPLDGVEKTIAKYDLTFWVREGAEGVSGSLEYNRDLFEASTVSRMIGHLRSLLAAAAASPERPWTELPLLTASEREELARLNATEAPFPADVPVHRLFEAQAARAPERTAVVFGAEALTYRELDERANRLAHALRALGVGAEERVGICVERSLEMVVAVLGVLKSGGAYVPLDPSHPRERLAYVLGDAGARVLLTQQSVAERLPELLASVERPLRLDADWPEVSRHPAASPEELALPGSRLAYTIYTSGSTGRPKGVQIPHRALVNFLSSMRERPGLSADDAVLAVTTLSFDIAGLELLLPLLNGARVIVAPAEAVGDGAALADLLKRSGATVMQATPATWRLLLESGWEGEAGLRVLCGGEALPRDLAERLLARTGELWNLYGPTETTVWSTVERVGSGPGPVPLGGPVASTRVHLLDRNGQPVPAGVAGELLIGGEGVARGYLGRPDLTAERFVPDPFASEPGARLYRTGDLMRRRTGGVLELLGRADFQVKIRGFRIELGEIEEVLSRCPEIRRAVAAVREDVPGDRRLVVYVVPRAAEGADPLVSFDPAGPRRFLRERVPEYMVPAAWVVLAELPLTPNGKVDRKALPAPEGPPAGWGRGFVPPRTEAERVVAAVWGEALRLDRVGVQDNFFDLGGHSLLLAQVHRRLRERFASELAVIDLFRYPTVESLALFLGPLRERAVTLPPSLVELQPRGSEPPLFLVHPLSGELLLYRYLVSGLGSGQPVYGFQARGFGDGQEPLARVEEMADLYVGSLLAFRPRGPYLLAGSSFGGLVAFEMARQLRSRGYEVALVALIDAPAPGGGGLESDGGDGQAELAIFHYVTGGDPTMPLERLRTLAPEERLELILQRGREMGALASSFGLAELRWLVQVVAANQEARRAYLPEPSGVRATYLRAAENEESQAGAWAAFALGGVEVQEVPGDHLSLHFPPHAEEAAARLGACIRKALRAAGSGSPPAGPGLPVPEAGGSHHPAEERDPGR